MHVLTRSPLDVKLLWFHCCSQLRVGLENVGSAVVLGNQRDSHRSLRRRGPEAQERRLGSGVSKTSRLPLSERDPALGLGPREPPGGLILMVLTAWSPERQHRHRLGRCRAHAKSSAGFQKIPLCAKAPNVATLRHRARGRRMPGM